MKHVVSCFLTILYTLQVGVLAVPITFKDCGASSGKILSVDVEPCDNPKMCSLKRGTSPTIKIKFQPTRDVSKITAVVHGIIEGIPMAFPLPNPNACLESGLVCPIVKQSTNEYTQTLEVKSIYPSIKLTVKWELKDENNKDIACAMFKAQVAGQR